MPNILDTTCFHFFETPKAVKLQSKEILTRRGAHTKRPLFIWEPQGKSCNVETLDQHIHAAGVVDVFSPNNAELDSLFEETASLEFDQDLIERQSKFIVDTGIGHGNKGCIVVRCAEHGCLVMSRDIAPTWLPAFFEAGSERVVDATGGGNAFLGGFAAGYEVTGSFVEAAKYGNVAASFVIEQVGVPSVTGEGESELWNGAKVRDRLASYQTRVQNGVK